MYNINKTQSLKEYEHNLNFNEYTVICQHFFVTPNSFSNISHSNLILYTDFDEH